MVEGSTAGLIVDAGSEHVAPVTLLGLPVHEAMQLISGAIGIAGIAMAAYFHWLERPAAARWASHYPWLIRALENKWYIDEVYDAVIVRPLRILGELCFIFDRLVIDGLVAGFGWVPKAIGISAQPAQRGSLQGYGLGMAVGGAAIVVLVLVALGWM